MTTVLVTGSAGFVGKHLVEGLKRRDGIRLYGFGRQNSEAELDEVLREADVIYHLAGVNRPRTPEEFERGNAGLTRDICARLQRLGRAPTIVLSSSIQAELDNPYGLSKKHAEEEVGRFSAVSGAHAIIYRLKNVFGKWCRPNYNSVVATFCHNTARGLPICISDPDREVSFIYIDDVVQAFIDLLDEPRRPAACEFREIAPSYTMTLGALAETIASFRAMRSTLVLPDLRDRFTHCLYATYLSYLPADGFAHSLEIKADSRGYLAEFIKSRHSGQIFVSRTRSGVTRGNHYHHTKTEKFLVLGGDAIIRFRHILNGDVITYQVSGNDLRVVDIPPGYTHSIENVGPSELIVLFWASEIFDPGRTDTCYDEVLRA
jgi:UDP-2-acetamido-2,6-beta-L-arabino-hexul-4-ose reductase